MPTDFADLFRVEAHCADMVEKCEYEAAPILSQV
jgi:hypothetical protein